MVLRTDAPSQSVIGTPPANAIPFNQPASGWTRYVTDADIAGSLAGDEHLENCEALLAGVLGVPRVLMTTSGTHALELAAFLLDLEEGAEIILPSFTYPATATAFMMRGLRPVLVDVDPATLNLDPKLLGAAIGPRTRAIVPVHYAGVACDMDAIMQIATAHGLAVVEDNAQGLFGSYRGKALGTFGTMSAVSFHSTKSFSCGAGGALTLQDAALSARAERVRDGGTNRYDFFRGNAPFYEWCEVGSNYLPADILAAILYPQLKLREQIIGRRLEIWQRYRSELGPWAARNGVALPVIPDGATHPAHLFYLVFPSGENRDRFIAHLREAGVASHFHYYPLHLSRAGQSLGYARGDCPHAEWAGAGLARLPLYPSLGDDQVARVIETALRFATA